VRRVAGKRDRGKAARRRAQMERLAASTDAGADRRTRARDAAERSASAGSSAGRWLVPADRDDPGGPAVPLDVVADLLALEPRTTLRGRGGDQLRQLAGRVVDLVELDASAPSGRSLAEVVTDDAELRDRLRPSLDLDALLAGTPVAGDRHDRTVRVAEALLERGAAHRAGDVDLYALVAPVGHERHARAQELETTVGVAVDGLTLPAGPDPAVVTVTGGWVAVGPVELFLASGRGLLQGTAGELAGAALATWLAGVVRGSADGWWAWLRDRMQVDAPALLDVAAGRAGSDHPDVVGGVLVDLIALRYPVAPPS
jgi:hypothetical protein